MSSLFPQQADNCISSKLKSHCDCHFTATHACHSFPHLMFEAPSDDIQHVCIMFEKYQDDFSGRTITMGHKILRAVNMKAELFEKLTSLHDLALHQDGTYVRMLIFMTLSGAVFLAFLFCHVSLFFLHNFFFENKSKF